jgi:hypothetical protein
VKAEPEHVKLKNLQLEAAARERLMTQQARKGLAAAVAICELWRLGAAL